MDREKVIKGLNEIGAFIAGRLGFEQARNFLRTIDDTVALLKEDCHNCKLECLLQKYDEQKEKYDALLKEQEVKPLRCKECSYHRNDGWCNEHGREVKKSDYCSFGARMMEVTQ